MILLQAITKQLRTFEPDIKIYDDPVPQDFKTPSFYIYEINSGSDDRIMGAADRYHNFAITYFPDDDLIDDEGFEIGVNHQCRSMRAKLFDNLLFLDDVKVHLNDRESNIDDGVLTFSFRLAFDVHEVEEDGVIAMTMNQGGILDDQ